MKCPVPECDGEMCDRGSDMRHCERGHSFPTELVSRITIAPLPKPEPPWRPRTKDELVEYVRAPKVGQGWDRNDITRAVQARTDDIARMLDEEAKRVEIQGCGTSLGFEVPLALGRMAQRIREME